MRAQAPSDLDAIAANPVLVQLGPREIRFATAADFLLSFSLPKFFFHATTAYAILRVNGIALGKADYLGKVRRAS